MHEMMANSPTDNECSSTSVDVSTTTRKSPSPFHGEADPANNDSSVVDVTSTSEEVEVDENNVVLDMSMGREVISGSSNSPQMMKYDDNIESPESESEELIIDEKFIADDSTAEVTPMELGDMSDEEQEVEGGIASPSEESGQTDQVNTIDPPISPGVPEIQSPTRAEVNEEDDDDDGDLQIDETNDSKNETAFSHIESSTVLSDVASPDPDPEENVDIGQEETADDMEVVGNQLLEDDVDNGEEEELDQLDVQSIQQRIKDAEVVLKGIENVEIMQDDSSTPTDALQSTDSNNAEETMHSTDNISSPAQNSSPESPDASQSSIKSPLNENSYDADGGESREPQSPEMSQNTNGISFDESQSQPSLASLPSPPETPNQAEKAPQAQSVPEEPEEVEEVDLEDGEIMDEEEEGGDDEDKSPKAPPPASPPPVSTPQKEKDKDSGKSKKKEKREKEKEKEELDPVKRLLAEVREKDLKEKSEKEKEREKRRSKKRSKNNSEKEKKEEPSKKKKRRMSEEEDDGEEFLLVRGASPTEVDGGGWGDDFRGGKRRRESEGSNSPPHGRHHRRPADIILSPPRPTRPKRVERKEPKSDVICAYFMQGKCQKSSDDCNFSHDAVPPRKMELCKFWMMDCCAKKEKCIYLHNDFPCKFYHTGLICRLADRCKFSHQPLSEATKQVLLKHIETAPKEILGDFPRLNRAGALNLINKMEAKINGVPYHEEESHKGNDNHMDHGPPQYGHHQHQDNRHGPPQGHGRGHDRSRGDRGHYGQNHNDHGHGGRGRGQDRGNDRGGGDRRQSRWEQTQPTRDDQHKLQELMDEAGIAGFYKDTLQQDNNQQQMPSNPPPNHNQMFPPQMQNMQPPLLPHPLLPQFLPHMLPQTQGLPQVNNPALASVLATLNIPSSTIVPNNLTQFQPPPLLPNPPPPLNTSQPPPQIENQNQSQQDPPADSSSGNNAIPDNLPKMQRDLFLRIQQQQLKNENKVQTQEKAEPEEPEENWYSDEEEEDSKKKEELKAEINDQISSVLNQIRQQSQQQQQPAISKEPDGLKTFFGDTDLRASAPTSTDFKDVDLRTNNMFKKIDILPATEVDASLATHGPMVYKVWVVSGLRDKPDYSAVRNTLTQSAILMDPRLGPKRSNSIPTPDSPTDQTADGGGNQPLNIPDGTPVFDPRMKAGNPPATSRPLLDQPPPTNPFPADNSIHGMNNYSNPFNRDPRGGQAPNSNQSQVQQPQQSPQTMANAAQNFALAAALMQQQWPNQQPPLDPNLFMLGFPFLPPVTSGQQQNLPNPGMDFNSLMGAGMRLRPPFNQPPQQQQQQTPPSSSWERFSQGQGQGDLSPPL